uniref:ADP-ribosylation factor-like protein 13B (inferred by orthology to a human protein) n=1 Tax=Strongyloides venezuelensis TaxID=75913 RepID=A0A0K0G0U3_STRVS
MGNCGLCSGGFRERKNRIFPVGDKRKITICLLGPENVGKTTILKAINGESPENVTQTNGFNQESIKFMKAQITIYDLGGNDKIREIWTNYYGEVYGSIFVWDTNRHSDEDIEFVKIMITAIINNPDMTGKPLLILLNKKDLGNSITEYDFCDKINLHQLASESGSHLKVLNCHALHGVGKNLDPIIHEGLEWLLEEIKTSYNSIDERVKLAIDELIKRQQDDKIKRQHRLAEIQAEQAEEDAKIEQAERAANGNVWSGETAPNNVENVDENPIPDVLPPKLLPPLKTNKVLPQNDETPLMNEGPNLKVFEIGSEDKQFKESFEMENLRKDIEIQTDLSFPVTTNNDDEEKVIVEKIGNNRRTSLHSTHDANRGGITLAPLD